VKPYNPKEVKIELSRGGVRRKTLHGEGNPLVIKTSEGLKVRSSEYVPEHKEAYENPRESLTKRVTSIGNINREQTKYADKHKLINVPYPNEHNKEALKLLRAGKAEPMSHEEAVMNEAQNYKKLGARPPTHIQRAVSHLRKETERGEHKPEVGGYKDHNHSGDK
jgi:hypothetical protein